MQEQALAAATGDVASSKTRSSSGSWFTGFKNMMRSIFETDQATSTTAATNNEVKVVVSQLDDANSEADTDIDSDSSSEEHDATVDDDATIDDAAIVIEQMQHLTPGNCTAIVNNDAVVFEQNAIVSSKIRAVCTPSDKGLNV
jgi:hypothetical protein